MNENGVNPANKFAEILRTVHLGRSEGIPTLSALLTGTYGLVGGPLYRKGKADGGKEVVQDLANPYQALALVARSVSTDPEFPAVSKSLAPAAYSVTIVGNKTRQGYARKRILKLAGYFFVGRVT